MKFARTLGVALLALVMLPAAAGAKVPNSSLVRHVFVIVLENENADTSFGPNSQAPYLAQTLTAQGQFLPNYYGVTHESLGNYIAMVSGQGANIETQADCQFYNDVLPGLIGPSDQAIGQGCVYPDTVKTIADQLSAAGFTWKGYMQDMGDDLTRDGSTTCAHPAPNSQDKTQSASATDQYAARHNPFVYFHSLLDSGACAANDVPFTQLSTDLASESTTPNFSFITPDLCNDGHDATCADGTPGGLPAADAFLKTWVPAITSSPAYQDNGLLVITFDEAQGDPRSPQTGDASACCNEPQFLNTPNNGGPIPGMGGGRVGAVLLSPFITAAGMAGTVDTTAYNHFSLLRSIEGIFGLGQLGYAQSPDPGGFNAMFARPKAKPKPARRRLRRLH